ncbi:hypothetical protein HRI_000986300 [Hibiscus trionum]|uniref:Uncharacterized protein n=1 Tax=Hibiscus trionum TaxID=183268 RepID=A0A9W7H925_HIBTR|nr:hypothetical protein HRI_000986300 [Hibiscus trionum]
MHFPWKKSKVARISRLVAGLHQSPKRGGSLVVETGFPTSVVDLFVKNGDRLRKSSKRKSGSTSSPQLLTPPTHPLPRPASCNDDRQSPETDVGEIVFITRENNDDERIPFRVVLKVSLAVALAVSTGSLAIWIMMAALLLVLIEFAGARFLGLSRPEPTTLFFYPAIRTCLNLKPRADELVVKQQGTELVESEDELKMEIETITCKNERSRSARIKTSLIKKFVPKKLRHGKRKKQGKSNKDKEPSGRSEKQEAGVDEEDESENEGGDVISISDRVLQVESEMEDVRKGNSGYVILIVILAGLIGGRGVAFFLTLACCFILICIGTCTQENDSDLSSGS